MHGTWKLRNLSVYISFWQRKKWTENTFSTFSLGIFLTLGALIFHEAWAQITPIRPSRRTLQHILLPGRWGRNCPVCPSHPWSSFGALGRAREVLRSSSATSAPQAPGWIQPFWLRFSQGISAESLQALIPVCSWHSWVWCLRTSAFISLMYL